MTRTQSIVLWCGIVAILLVTVFPPIVRIIPSEEDGVSSFQQAIRYEYYFTKSTKKIFLQRLFIQWFIIAVITAGLMYTFKQQGRKG